MTTYLRNFRDTCAPLSPTLIRTYFAPGGLRSYHNKHRLYWQCNVTAHFRYLLYSQINFMRSCRRSGRPPSQHTLRQLHLHPDLKHKLLSLLSNSPVSLPACVKAGSRINDGDSNLKRGTSFPTLPFLSNSAK